ncbi:MAG: hypothetical protein HND39_16430 [Ignavibacteriota bacterium]|jgi:hypothetical protein|nr:MAG: hypothetical protein EDM72_06790 [Chlorobiota bacterium]MBE7477675.1 hypothetical protein [Ignavibacteriales bacterium]MBL1123784.1 hypothetical protein [Ignavibacteriota bacterium]MBV6419217.1 hypothetical protein [Ignavibacteriaceae bacterium]MCE7855979.1 hypothetical protein [Ignavibacteria bacterium CHB3]MEB2295246.1 hypothetical protein [Ignavibacteria bacterium]
MLKFILLFLFAYVSVYTQQDDKHVWKVINADDGSKFWFDSASLDTTKGDKFNIWILQTNQPPKTYEGIDGEVFRVKTLYTINLTTVKYGILKVRYYNLSNQEIFSFDYDKPMPPESIRYPYPITDNSILYYLIKELYEPKGERTQKIN